MTDKLLIRLEEAADMLSVSRSLAYRMAARGELPTVVISGSRRVPVERLRDLIGERTRPAAEAPGDQR